MLQPKKLKYRKPFKIMPKNKRPVNDSLQFGSYGLMALENAMITAAQIDAVRRAIVGHVKRKGKLWIRIYPDRPITKHPAETRMGSGKGEVDHYAAIVKLGRIMFELGGVEESVAMEALRKAIHKLPIKVKVVKKN